MRQERCHHEHETAAVQPRVQNRGGAPGAQQWPTGVHYTVADHLGTPLLQTDTSANVYWRMETEPYGKVWALRAGDVHQPLRLPGQVAEQFETGANGATERSYNNYRWYRPGWGRYNQADPIGLAGGFNLYAYARSNSIRFGDAVGLYPGDPFPDPDKAAIDALQTLHARFKLGIYDSGVEYFGRVYYDPIAGAFYATGFASDFNPVGGDLADLPSIPARACNRGFFHNHPGSARGSAVDPNSAPFAFLPYENSSHRSTDSSEYFSGYDLDIAISEAQPAYVSTVSGAIKKFTPRAGATIPAIGAASLGWPYAGQQNYIPTGDIVRIGEYDRNSSSRALGGCSCDAR